MSKRKCCEHCDCSPKVKSLGALDADVWAEVARNYDRVSNSANPINVDYLTYAGRYVFGEPTKAIWHGSPALEYHVFLPQTRSN